MHFVAEVDKPLILESSAVTGLAINANRASNNARTPVDHARRGIESIHHASLQVRQIGMEQGLFPVTIFKLACVDTMDGRIGIECMHEREMAMTAPPYGAQHVVVNAASTHPSDTTSCKGMIAEPKKIVVIGATGTIGTAVTNALASAHGIVRASRHGPVQVDLGNPTSIAALFEAVTEIDAIVCCAASAQPQPFVSLSDDDVARTLAAKLIGQVNLVRQAVRYLRNDGSVTLTAGTFAQPASGGVLGCLVNAGIKGFVKAAAAEMPRGLRVNVVSPPRVKESLEKRGLDSTDAMPARDVARAYVVAIDGMLQGQIIIPGCFEEGRSVPSGNRAVVNDMIPTRNPSVIPPRCATTVRAVASIRRRPTD